MVPLRILLFCFICNGCYGLGDSKSSNAMKNLVENTLREMDNKFQEIRNMVNESMHKLIQEICSGDEIPKSNCTNQLARLWVSRVTNFSSQYSTTSWSASKVIGKPDVYPSYGDLAGAWTQSVMKAPDHFITVAFAYKTFIRAINIYETFHGGAVIRIEAKMPNGTWYTVWRTAAPTDITQSRIFSPEFKAIPFLCDELKLVLNTTVATGWVEIDAVQVIGQEHVIRQWVSAVTNFSSQYSTTSWSASKVIGEPDVYPSYGDLAGAWTQRTRAPDHFITVAFAQKIFIETINIYETFHGGAVIRIEARMSNGTWYTLWKTAAATDITQSRIFSPGFKETPFLCNELNIVLDTTVATGWVEIDAVEVIGQGPGQENPADRKTQTSNFNV